CYDRQNLLILIQTTTGESFGFHVSSLHDAPQNERFEDGQIVTFLLEYPNDGLASRQVFEPPHIHFDYLRHQPERTVSLFQLVSDKEREMFRSVMSMNKATLSSPQSPSPSSSSFSLSPSPSPLTIASQNVADMSVSTSFRSELRTQRIKEEREEEEQEEEEQEEEEEEQDKKNNKEKEKEKKKEEEEVKADIKMNSHLPQLLQSTQDLVNSDTEFSDEFTKSGKEKTGGGHLPLPNRIVDPKHDNEKDNNTTHMEETGEEEEEEEDQNTDSEDDVPVTPLIPQPKMKHATPAEEQFTDEEFGLFDIHGTKAQLRRLSATVVSPSQQILHSQSLPPQNHQYDYSAHKKTTSKHDHDSFTDIHKSDNLSASVPNSKRTHENEEDNKQLEAWNKNINVKKKRRSGIPKSIHIENQMSVIFANKDYMAIGDRLDDNYCVTHYTNQKALVLPFIWTNI
ncbi:hypothetical protein RFI_20619, partial [Reticulomyxa filosa]